ncbi:hypothetical protein NDU88_005786 [Pleurodeles waltl]|uniref:Uncharacterized protein n=1 Tax=Pleurodeles waltl TaxID=8319 RepID=A0AAV7N6U9_PLEWA|nr:hypothetical protein NDU88_005786 [Pleurodeles waltl]
MQLHDAPTSMGCQGPAGDPPSGLPGQREHVGRSTTAGRPLSWIKCGYGGLRTIGPCPFGKEAPQAEESRCCCGPPSRAGRTERSSAAATGTNQVTARVHSHRSGAIPRMGISLISGATRLPAGPFRAAPSARGPGEEPARGPGKQTHQPRLRAPARQAASSSSAPEVTPVSRRGSLPRLVVLSS